MGQRSKIGWTTVLAAAGAFVVGMRGHAAAAWMRQPAVTLCRPVDTSVAAPQADIGGSLYVSTTVGQGVNLMCGLRDDGTVTHTQWAWINADGRDYNGSDNANARVCAQSYDRTYYWCSSLVTYANNGNGGSHSPGSAYVGGFWLAVDITDIKNVGTDTYYTAVQIHVPAGSVISGLTGST